MKDGGTQSTLVRGFLIAEKIVQADRPLSSAFLAEELDLPKATVHRICQQLEEEGLLQREPGGKRFTGGRRLRGLAMSTLSNSVIGAHRHSILQALSREVGETCNLTVLDGNEIVYLDRVETNWAYRIHLPVGTPALHGHGQTVSGQHEADRTPPADQQSFPRPSHRDDDNRPRCAG